MARTITGFTGDQVVTVPAITVDASSAAVAGIKMVRWGHAPHGTYGTLTLPDGQQLYTVENPWLDNRASVSCIPVGAYTCKPRRYYRGGYEAIEITNVTGRSFILFHVANVPTEVRGCIGVGMGHGLYKGQWSVTSSTAAFRELMKQLGGKTFTLTISNH